MGLVVVASAKGAPGATTVALTLAAVWPRRALLAELDPCGSDLIYRLRSTEKATLATEGGVLSYLLGGDADGGGTPLDHAERVGAGLDVLVGPPPARAGEASGGWGLLAERLAGGTGFDTLADCGRLHPDS